MKSASQMNPRPAYLRGQQITLHVALHVLRNPFGWDPKEIEKVRLWAADELERLAVVVALAQKSPNTN
jgi:hypothetical protein